MVVGEHYVTWKQILYLCTVFHTLTATNYPERPLASVRNCGKDLLKYLAMVGMMSGNKPSAQNALAARSFLEYHVH